MTVKMAIMHPEIIVVQDAGTLDTNALILSVSLHCVHYIGKMYTSFVLLLSCIRIFFCFIVDYSCTQLAHSCEQFLQCFIC